MMSIPLTPSFLKSCVSWLSDRTGTVAGHDPKEPEHLIRQAERDLVNEMIWNCPEAFSSELDVHYMMHMHRGRS